jgi:hypothetical protein
MMMCYLFILIIVVLLSFIVFYPGVNLRILLLFIKPPKDFAVDEKTLDPDYSDFRQWAAHPGKKNITEIIPPNSSLENMQLAAEADIFYIHRTTLISRCRWNSDTRNQKLNNITDKQAIRNQAGIFNGSCRIFAPRYRQATLYSFFDKKGNGEKALDLGYKDVRAAFLYYLQHFNNGRPVIIAGHSQGAQHATNLIREFFDGKDLEKKLIAAYLTGMPLQINTFRTIPFSENPSQTGCFVSWSTFGDGVYPNYFKEGYKTAVTTNPLTWDCQQGYAGYEKHLGAVSPGFKKIHRHCINAKCGTGVLWIKNKKILTFIPLPLKNYVVMDFDLFYMNTRENVKQRIEAYFNGKIK